MISCLSTSQVVFLNPVSTIETGEETQEKKIQKGQMGGIFFYLWLSNRYKHM